MIKNYRYFSRVLHKLVFGSRVIQSVSFDVEKFLYLSSSENYSSNPVFVMGLARSGTTTLLRLLHQTNVFHAVSYRDVPFVLMPNTWSKLTQIFFLENKPIERSHGDNILVDFDSVEAFEEVFWTTLTSDTYINHSNLMQYRPDRQSMDEFKKYIGMVANKFDQGRRYLSKNNNNLLRLNTLSKSLPDGKFIVLWRNPLQTAFSLFKMQERFSKMQVEDQFVLEYMNLIGHFEFGLNHKPFHFTTPFETKYNPVNPNYWLAYWIYIHKFLLNNIFTENVRFLSYESLCLDSVNQLKNLFKWLEISSDSEVFISNLQISRSNELPNFDDDLRTSALELEQQLIQKSCD